MKTGRRDGRESFAGVLENFIPDLNDSISLVLSRFQSAGVDVEGTVALLGEVLSEDFPLCRNYDETDQKRIGPRKKNCNRTEPTF